MIPLLTLCLGPFGPSGLIPIDILLSKDFIICRTALRLPLFLFFEGLFVEPRIEPNPRMDITFEIISPSRCFEIRTLISELLSHVRGHIKS